MGNIILGNEKVNFVWEPILGTNYWRFVATSKISPCAFDLFGK